MREKIITYTTLICVIGLLVSIIALIITKDYTMAMLAINFVFLIMIKFEIEEIHRKVSVKNLSNNNTKNIQE